MKTTDVNVEDLDELSDLDEMPVRFVIHFEYNPRDKKSGGLKCRIEPEFLTPQNLTLELVSESDPDSDIQEDDDKDSSDDKKESHDSAEKSSNKKKHKSKSRHKDEVEDENSDDSSDENEDEEPDPILECWAKAYSDE